MSSVLEHHGVKRRSGRYKWGSGENPYQHELWFLNKVSNYKKQGLSEKEIAKKMGLSIRALRAETSRAKYRKQEYLDESIKYELSQPDPISVSDMAHWLGVSESTIRKYTNEGLKTMKKQMNNTVDVLMQNAEKTGYLDVGSGMEHQMGISRHKLDTAIRILTEEHGYHVHNIWIRRLDDISKATTIKTLTKNPDATDTRKHASEISTMESWTNDGGTKYQNIETPKSIDSKRIHINYGDKGGEAKDGLIELRRGVKDLDLGAARYAQVRIAVDGTHYLKGMAVYSDNMPPGKDIIFNTNKKSGTPKEAVFKEMKLDNPDNPFGATIKRQNKTKTVNIVNEEGDWDRWKSTVSSQMLSKQPLSLIKEQLGITKKKIFKEYDELSTITNPSAKHELLTDFSKGLDTKMAHLKAAGFPGTKGHVLIPFPDMKPNEIYAPNYKQGDRVVLVRYPHGGTFEIAELTVNNKFKRGKSTLGNAPDAVGIHPSVAPILSGADFDGDTAYITPNNKGKIKRSNPLKELQDFDPKMYKVGHETMSKQLTQTKMGEVSNLITDMTLKDAPMSEIARAIKHSMVVIDAHKHHLDWKKSAEDNGIAELRRKYQQHFDPIKGKTIIGASTLISKSKKTKEFDTITPSGKDVKEKKSIISQVEDAHILSSGTEKEKVYADYVNELKALKRKVDKEISEINIPTVDREAKRKYAAEVDSLNEKLRKSEIFKPRERQAQIMASDQFFKKVRKGMDKGEIKRLRQQVLTGARSMTGPEDPEIRKDKTIHISDKEWEAIQANAISKDRLRNIYKRADMDEVRRLATPDKGGKMTDSRISRAKAMLDNDFTFAEVADALGVSTATIRRAIKDNE